MAWFNAMNHNIYVVLMRSTAEPCQQFSGKYARCKLRGGKSTGAKNPPIKHGMYSKDAIERRKQYATLLGDKKLVMKEVSE